MKSWYLLSSATGGNQCHAEILLAHARRRRVTSVVSARRCICRTVRLLPQMGRMDWKVGHLPDRHSYIFGQHIIAAMHYPCRVGWSVASDCVSVSVHALKEKWLTLATLNLVHIHVYSVAGPWHALNLRSEGKQVKLSHVLPALVCRSIWLLGFLVSRVCLRVCVYTQGGVYYAVPSSLPGVQHIVYSLPVSSAADMLHGIADQSSTVVHVCRSSVKYPTLYNSPHHF